MVARGVVAVVVVEVLGVSAASAALAAVVLTWVIVAAVVAYHGLTLTMTSSPG